MVDAMKDLLDNRIKYNENYEMLVKTTGTKEHSKYIKIEKDLNEKDIMLRKKLNLFIYSMCPVRNTNKYCTECSGYYKTIHYKTNKNYKVLCKREESENPNNRCPYVLGVKKNGRKK